MRLQPYSTEPNQSFAASQSAFIAIEYNMNFDITHVSATVRSLTGGAAQDYIGRLLTTLIAEPDIEIIRQFTQNRLETDGSAALRCSIQHKSGAKIPVELRLELISHQPGQWHTAVGLITPVAEHPDSFLQDPQHFLDSIANAVPDIVFVFSLIPQEVLYINAAAEKILGYTPQEILEYKSEVIQAIHPEDLPQLKDFFIQIVSESDDHFYERELRMADRLGHYLPMNARAAIFTRNDDGTAQTIIGSVRDMSAQKAQADRQMEARAERERLHFLSQFIRSISHDFRTPLSIINSSAYFLVRKENIEDRRGRADLIEKQVQRLEEMLDQVALSIHLHIPEWYTFAPVAVGEIANEVIAENESNRDITVAMRIPADAPMIRGDIVFLKLALNELFKNALEHTPAGGSIIFDLQAEGSTAIIHIQDTGDGIAAENIPHIFEYYFRADAARSLAGSHHHIGLGLAIVKKIIDTHEGQINVESSTGEGTRFTIRLPVWQEG